MAHARHIDLVAGVAQSIEIDTTDFYWLGVTNRTQAHEVYVRFDGTEAEAEADDNYIVLGYRPFRVEELDSITVEIVCAQNCAVSIEAFD